MFLNKHLDCLNYAGSYIAIDTFEGFTKSSIEVEKKERNKTSKEDIRGLNKFTVNSKEWFDSTMKQNSISRVRSIKGDVEELDLILGDKNHVCFALIDVDLYKPTLAALNCIHDKMIRRGGVIVVDDCAKNHVYDGSRSALEEFCESKKIQFDIVEGKLGVIRIKQE